MKYNSMTVCVCVYVCVCALHVLPYKAVWALNELERWRRCEVRGKRGGDDRGRGIGRPGDRGLAV